MDKRILEFSTQAKADTALQVINQIAENYWIEQGYTVIDGELIGKRNGKDDLDACRTTTWDTVKESPDNTFYFTTPTSKYPDWRDYLPDGVVMPDDKLFPSEWIEQYEQAE